MIPILLMHIEAVRREKIIRRAKHMQLLMTMKTKVLESEWAQMESHIVSTT